MKIHVLKYWERIRASLWFLPTVMTVGSALLAYGMVAIDRFYGHKLPDALNWAYTGGAEGASAMLSTIAGSMITLAGVVFSLTLVALSLASSQFGPRLLRNFMRDTVNQVTIGTFIATFLYCLLVLRTIRRLDELTFVPQLSVTVGLMFALASLGVLIYFIHHVAVSIQADEIIAQVAAELEDGAERLFPEHIGAGERPPRAAIPVDFEAHATPVCAAEDGYLELVDSDELMACAQENELLLRIERRPGRYVIAGLPLLTAYPSSKVTAEASERMRNAFVLGTTRTAAQDIEFALNQLVEIAVRALSPGVNDPFTAMTCVDRLGSALCRLVERQMPSAYRLDERGELRVIVPETDFPQLLDAAFDQIRQYASGSVAVTIRMLEALGSIAVFARRREDLSAIEAQAQMILIAARRSILEASDLRDIERRHLDVTRVLYANSAFASRD